MKYIEKLIFLLADESCECCYYFYVCPEDKKELCELYTNMEGLYKSPYE